MLIHYIKVAIRNLWKYKVQNLIGILGLAVGFACFSLCTFVMQQYLTADTEYPGANRMYRLSTQYRSDYNGNIYTALNAFPEVEKVTICHAQQRGIMKFEDEKLLNSYSVILMEVDTCFFDFFSLKLLAGNLYTVTHSSNSIVLFERKAKEFSDNYAELIGKTVSLWDDEIQYQITGIVKEPRNSFIMGHDLYSGFVMNKSGSYLEYEVYGKWTPQQGFGNTFLRLSPRSSIDSFRKRLEGTDFGFKIDPNRLGMRIEEDGRITKITAEGKKESFVLSPIKDIHKRESETNAYIGIFIIGLLILLMVLFNYMSFQTALFYNRLRECAIRKTAGSGKVHTFFLFFSEVLIAFVLAFLIAFFLVRFLVFLLNGTVYFHELTPELLHPYMFQYFFFVLFFVVAFCFIPSFAIDKLSVRIVLLGLSGKGKKAIGRDVLLFVQLFILFIAIAASAVVSLQTYRLRSGILDNIPQEEQNEIFSVRCGRDLLDENIHEVMQSLSSSTLYENVVLGFESVLNPESSIHFNNLILNGKEKGVADISLSPVSPGFFELFRCRLIAGSFFDENSDLNDIVINDVFADLYGLGSNPVGQQFQQYRIVGVMESLHIDMHKSFHRKGKEPIFYYNEKNDNNKYNYVIYVKSTKGKNKEAREFFKNSLDNALPEHIIGVETRSLKEEIDGMLIREDALARLLISLFIISLIIGLLSIYSAVSMSTEKRRKEVAIRKINGAGLYDIVLLFFRKYIVLWTVVCILASPFVYYYANDWLNNYIDRISLNVLFFIAIYLIVLLLIISTVIFQILKVAKENPAETLKMN
ncbi:ABC transporter permease [Bacteroidales bacterium OttesenSCG-928-A17]|nr:ABC transporter permease [Bacteroidales bacterium OttesenSCG-928-A17]